MPLSTCTLRIANTARRRASLAVIPWYGWRTAYPAGCCEAEQLDPYEWEVYEHWAVSTWLAEKLTAQSERVDTDFAGLNIWARTTTGQAISVDGCIQRIYADMMAPHTLDSVAPGA